MLPKHKRFSATPGASSVTPPKAQGIGKLLGSNTQRDLHLIHWDFNKYTTTIGSLKRYTGAELYDTGWHGAPFLSKVQGSLQCGASLAQLQMPAASQHLQDI